MRIVVLIISAVIGLNAYAVGFGKIKVRSYMGEPLQADIPVLGDDAKALDSLKVHIASDAEFKRFNIDKSALVNDIDFTVDKKGGDVVVKLNSNKAFYEPYVKLLLKFSSNSGSYYRIYNVLLDPKGYRKQIIVPDDTGNTQRAVVKAKPVPKAKTSSKAKHQPEKTVPKNAPKKKPLESSQQHQINPRVQVIHSTSSEKLQKVIKTKAQPHLPRPEFQSLTSPPVVPKKRHHAKRERLPTIKRGHAVSYGPVRYADTLWRIALLVDIPKGYSIEQWMVATVNKNPQAFAGGNIHGLIAGETLALPTSVELGHVSTLQARIKIRKHNHIWKKAYPKAVSSLIATKDTKKTSNNSRLKPKNIAESGAIIVVSTTAIADEAPVLELETTAQHNTSNTAIEPMVSKSPPIVEGAFSPRPLQMASLTPKFTSQLGTETERDFQFNYDALNGERIIANAIRSGIQLLSAVDFDDLAEPFSKALVEGFEVVFGRSFWYTDIDTMPPYQQTWVWEEHQDTWKLWMALFILLVGSYMFINRVKFTDRRSKELLSSVQQCLNHNRLEDAAAMIETELSKHKRPEYYVKLLKIYSQLGYLKHLSKGDASLSNEALKAKAQILTKVQDQDSTFVRENSEEIDEADVMESKLNLATIYLNMGNVADAKKLLEDIVQYGNVSQKAEAKSLIDNLH